MKATDKIKLEERIRTLEGLNDDERASLLGLLRENKTYGLVWEDKPEEVEERLRNELPVLVEDTAKALTDGGDDAPNHILIEGDNLEALTTLAYTHVGKIDVIYIDPPYNTLKAEKDDFTYNDKRIDATDAYPHSKWASFMNKRLKIAKRLLSYRGCIFISISDHEFANLKLICDSIFGEKNYVGNIIWNSTKSVTNTALISVSHTYNLVYFKDINYIIENRTKFRIPDSEEGFSNPDNDPRGPWKADPFQVGGWRPNQQYIIVNPNTGVEYRPNPNCSWKNDYNNFLKLQADNRIVFGRTGNGGPQRKRFLSEALERGRVAKTIWDDIETTTNGTQLVKTIFGGETAFSNAKPISLIHRMLQLGGYYDSCVLDFFAGSGTTLHAVMQLNAEDGGKRQCILCTNNENGICENVTYERNKRVINGYTKPNGEFVEGLHNNNLRYYRTDFVGRSRSTKNMRRLVALSTDMLCIKENLYDEKKTFAGMPTFKNIYRYFEHGEHKMLIIYDERYVDEIVKMIATVETTERIKVYVFSPSEDPWEASFEPVNEKVTLCALPQAIYNTYKRILPKRKPQPLTANVEGDALAITDEDENIGGLFGTIEEEGGEV
ncbi:MAG: site-specific DNA-methyltransferase [Clostridium sp.]|nr:site-specific DNA-methyltransferase [Clostridium sp.]